jgi:NCAIR mutase (PurE)-related protein
MKPDALRALLAGVAHGGTTVEEALGRLRHFPSESLDFATIDHHRTLRQGLPEVVYAAHKTTDQVIAICAALAEKHGSFLATRCTDAQGAALRERFPRVRWNALGRTAALRPPEAANETVVGDVLVITAGTSDLPASEEAAATLEAFGIGVRRLNDVGVAGIHRLFAAADAWKSADVLIVAAGMEGALPSVIGGLVGVPIIAIPTSVGYGASFNGLAALLAMLNSCAPGVSVVNIDNGFGAAVAAARILLRR